MADIINVDPHAGNQTPIDITNGQEIEKTTFAQRFERALNIVQKGIRIGWGPNGDLAVLGGNDGPMPIPAEATRVCIKLVKDNLTPTGETGIFYVVEMRCQHGRIICTYTYFDGDLINISYMPCDMCGM